jgi:hypothetical protein
MIRPGLFPESDGSISRNGVGVGKGIFQRGKGLPNELNNAPVVTYEMRYCEVPANDILDFL